MSAQYQHQVNTAMRMVGVLSFFLIFDFIAFSRNVPTSKRSQTVLERVEPDLRRQLRGKDLSLGAPIFIRIFKESKELEMWVKKGASFERFKVYPVHHFSGKLGPKLEEGDKQAPEGFYYVTPGRMNPKSRFHLSFNLGYPNAYDRFHKRTGSALMVHGSTVSIGCFAMTDPRIEEIYTLAHHALENGQPFFRVHIFPFRMTETVMKKHQDSEWIHFWKNLQEGYSFFERSRLPPNVEVRSGRYVFD